MERTQHPDPEDTQINAGPPQPSAAGPFDDYEDGFGDEPLPSRPRARYLTPLTACLMALILGGVGFFVGVRVEKSKTSSSGTSAFARGGFPGASALSTSGSSKTTSGATSGGSASSLYRRFATAGGFSGATGNGTVGTVSSVDGDTIYVKETSGNTVKVKLNSATTISKSESVSREKLNPGDSVVIQGSAGSGGTVQATSVSDSGASASSSTSSSSSSSSSSGNASSAIRSLFGS